MQKLNLIKNGSLKLEECLRPKFNDAQCLIEVKFCGICSTDIYRSHSNGAYFYPLVMGHEIAGKIENVGQKVKNFSIGDKVAVFPLIPCFSCAECNKGNFILCHDYSYHGSRCSGGYANFMAVNEWNLIKLPEQINLKDAAFLEPAAVVLHALRKSDVFNTKEKSILIIGAGFLGLLMVQMLITKSPKCNIYLLDRNHFKFDGLPKEVKTATSIDQFKEQSFDLVFEGTGSAIGINLAIERVLRGGKVCLLGNPVDDVLLVKKQFSNILRKEINIFGSWNSTFRHEPTDDWAMVLELIKDGLHPSHLVSHQLDLAEVSGFLKKCWQHKSGIEPFPHIKGLVKL